MKKFISFLLVLILVSCSSNESSELQNNDENQSQEIVFEQGLGKDTSEFVTNWNKLVSEISSDDETLFYFSIDPEKVQWTTIDQEVLYYQFGFNENTESVFVLNLLVENGIVEGVEFFSPVENDEVTTQRARLFFLIIIAMSDDSLDKDGRESVLSKVGLYEEVENLNQIGGGVTINQVNYVIEPVIFTGRLVGLNFYSARSS